jgi:PAS domain S-box-containing protein
MRRLGISQRLYSIIAVSGIGLVAAAALFAWQLRDVRQTLEALHADMRQHDQARRMQIALKAQGQAWKEMLLRGSHPGDLAQHRAAFSERSEAVRTIGEELTRTLGDAQGRDKLDQFLAAHDALGRQYDAALAQFIASKGLDPRAADEMVRGQDRGLTDLIDQIVARTDVLTDAEAEVAAIRSKAVEVAVAVGALLILLLAGGAAVSRSITQPIAKTVAALERVAVGDLRTRVTITGNDEVTRMNRALNTTVEAIQRTHAQLTDAVTATEAARERLALLHEIDRAILAIHGPIQIAETALRHFRQLVRCPRAVLALYDVATGTGTWVAVDVEGHTERPAGTRFPLEMMGDLGALQRGETQIVEASKMGHLPEGRAVAAEGIRSYAVVPLIAEGELIGSMNVGAAEPGGPPVPDLGVAREIAAQLAIALQQSRLHQQAQASRDRLEAVVDSSPLAIITTDLTGLVQTWNPAATALFRWRPDEVVGRPLPIIPAQEQDAYAALLARYRQGETVTHIETQRVRKDGVLVDVVLSVAPLLDAHGRPLGVMGMLADVTHRKQLELQLQQAQKMEAIGQLAGGVAHDFNNLLTVIGGRSSLLLMTMPADNPGRKHVELIERTSQRAAGLTRQLLAFSRKQVLQPTSIDLNTLAAGLTPMLRRLIGEHIEIMMVPGPDLDHVMADPGQIEQVIMNLVVNARDAMPEGGMLKIETANRKVLEAGLHAEGRVPPGQYVIVSVQDAGTGIDAPTLARIFEPFFTTKDPGKGTGLGLSTVHGIVHQSGGYIGVDSAVGRGTTFTIYLPRITAPVPVTDAPTGPQELMRGTETVLLVEDEEDVRRLSSEILKTCGYTVLETGDPLEALVIGEQRKGTIDLLLTDMVMPGMRGSELADRLEATNPKLHVLCMSGYADEMIAAAANEPARVFLPKPFAPDDLANKVRQALARS